MADRLELHEIFASILGTRNVYYQPPSNTTMNYPTIRYQRRNIENEFADDLVYKQDISYEVIVIDKNPDSTIVVAVSQLPTCRHERHYVANNLNHDVFTIYY